MLTLIQVINAKKGGGILQPKARLLIFLAVAEPRNSVEILSNTCLYNIFETYFSDRGYLLAVNLQIYLETSSLKRANNVLKVPGVD